MVSALMTEAEAAKYLKLAPRTLRNWRSQQPDRLPALKQGRIIRYERKTVQEFLTKGGK